MLGASKFAVSVSVGNNEDAGSSVKRSAIARRNWDR
jgi:hypothetical protein